MVWLQDFHGFMDVIENDYPVCNDIDGADTLFDLVEKYVREKRKDVFVQFGAINENGEDVYKDKPIMLSLHRTDSLHSELCYPRILSIDSQDGDKWKMAYIADMWIQMNLDTEYRDHFLRNIVGFREMALKAVKQAMEEEREVLEDVYEACHAKRGSGNE